MSSTDGAAAKIQGPCLSQDIAQQKLDLLAKNAGQLSQTAAHVRVCSLPGLCNSASSPPTTNTHTHTPDRFHGCRLLPAVGVGGCQHL